MDLPSIINLIGYYNCPDTFLTPSKGPAAAEEQVVCCLRVSAAATCQNACQVATH